MHFNTLTNYPFFKINEDSYFYRFVFTSTDKAVYRALLRSVLSRKCIEFDNGFLIANIREDTLASKTGQISLSTLKRSLNRLVRVGAVIRVRHRRRNNQYIVGFRHPDGNERLYFIDYLSDKFGDLIEENVKNQQTTCPKIDIKSYCLKEEWKTFIRKNLNKPHTLFNTRLEGGLKVMELMFGVDVYYEKPLEKVINLPGLIGQIELSRTGK
jgi:predicted transcriptional regulator